MFVWKVFLFFCFVRSHDDDDRKLKKQKVFNSMSCSFLTLKRDFTESRFKMKLGKKLFHFGKIKEEQNKKEIVIFLFRCFLSSFN